MHAKSRRPHDTIASFTRAQVFCKHWVRQVHVIKTPSKPLCSQRLRLLRSMWTQIPNSSRQKRWSPIKLCWRMRLRFNHLPLPHSMSASCAATNIRREPLSSRIWVSICQVIGYMWVSAQSINQVHINHYVFKVEPSASKLLHNKQRMRPRLNQNSHQYVHFKTAFAAWILPVRMSGWVPFITTMLIRTAMTSNAWTWPRELPSDWRNTRGLYRNTSWMLSDRMFKQRLSSVKFPVLHLIYRISVSLKLCFHSV